VFLPVYWFYLSPKPILPSTNLSTAKTATVKNREPHQTIITNTAESTKQPCRDAAIQEEAPFFRISVTPMIQHSPSSINSQRQHKTLTAGAALSSTIVCFSLSIIFVAQQLQLFLTPQGVADILL
jgi:hypothetical protein